MLAIVRVCWNGSNVLFSGGALQGGQGSFRGQPCSMTRQVHARVGWVLGGYDHYRPTMTHLLHGLLEERHNGRVTLDEVLGCATELLGRVDVRRVRGTK